MDIYNGWLIVNSYYNPAKFHALYKVLEESAQKAGLRFSKWTSDQRPTVIGSKAKEPKPAFVLFWDKDVQLAHAMELSGLRLFNSATAITLADDKIETALKLAAAGIPIPDTIPAPTCFPGCRRNPASAEEAARLLGWPLVIKENKGSFGQQVYLANNKAEAERILTHIGEHDCLFQRYIAPSRGKDLRVTVVGGKAICAMERHAATPTEFRSNIGVGGTAVSRPISALEEKLAVDAANALGLDFAGVDILLGRDETERYVCEVNSNPQLQSTIDTCGINPATNIMWHIRSLIKGTATAVGTTPDPITE
ncbi:MAG: RimK family alpha-L-glutamate ligase [Oscillospiraceae bacterium]|nr:RimK family alpha-L-glutamate ligase [Oscillospiraceae bacterium]